MIWVELLYSEKGRCLVFGKMKQNLQDCPKVMLNTLMMMLMTGGDGGDDYEDYNASNFHDNVFFVESYHFSS